MAYVPVPKDLNAVKTKVLLNLTKRQLVCFGAGAALGVPLFFLLKAHTGVSTAAICMPSSTTSIRSGTHRAPRPTRSPRMKMSSAS